MITRSMLRLREHTAEWVPSLTAEEIAGLQSTGVASVTPAAGGGWSVGASDLVGVLSVGNLQIHVEPKIPIAQLLFLLEFAADPSGWRPDAIDLDEAVDPVSAVARAFVTLAERALQRGVLRGYVTSEEALPVLRGRLRAGDQLSRRVGIALPLEVVFDDFTADIAENQVLVSAADQLLRTGTGGVLRARLLRLMAALEGVQRWPDPRRLPQIRWTSLNRRYRPAVVLAELVLRSAGLLSTPGGVRASGFLFEMHKVFEDFLASALTDPLESIVGRVSAQDRHTLDVEERVDLRPDLVWWDGDRCLTVIDAKYKDRKGATPPGGDLYQLVSYCTAYGVARGHLVYARGVPRDTFTIRNSGIVVDVWSLDLTRPPIQLVSDVRRLAGLIASEVDPMKLGPIEDGTDDVGRAG